MARAWILGFTVFLYISYVSGHGRMLDPPNRSSMWRYGFPTEPNYTDMELFCGGMSVQYDDNGGNCGICGDNFADPTPRDNESGGKYGKNIIVKTYKKGAIIPVFVELTQEHAGYFEFGLCNMDKNKESEDCFKNVFLEDGSPHYVVPGEGRYVNHTMTLQLPSDVTCKQCVLRWHYRTGNNIGTCDDGSQQLGCGDQETFRGCADVEIV